MLRRSRLLVRCAVAVGVGLLTFSLAELGYRGWSAWNGQPYDAARTEHSIAEVASSLLERTPRGANEPEDIDGKWASPLLHPYLGFDRLGSLDPFHAMVVDLTRRRSERTYNICVLGGSVAAGFVARGGQRLSARLMADPRFAGIKVRVHGLARGAHKQPQQALSLSWLLAHGALPDAVIELDGFNEVAVANLNIVNGLPALAAAAGAMAAARRTERFTRDEFDLLLDVRRLQRRVRQLLALSQRWGCSRSALLGNGVLRRLHGLRLEAARLQVLLLSAVRTPNALDPIDLAGAQAFSGTPFEAALRAWFEGSLSLAGMCRMREIFYLHALQPTLHDEARSP
jgi:hypothetical protein